MKQYDDYSVEELRAALQRYFLYAELDEEAVDEMERILAALRKKAPFQHPHTTEEMWAEFQEEHSAELAALGTRQETETEEVVEKEPEKRVIVPHAKAEPVETEPAEKHPGKGRGLFRFGLIAAAVIVLMLAVTATAAALGYNLWGWVPVWGDEVMSFEPEETEKKPTVETIPDMLVRLGITDKLYPTWLPEDFIRTEIRVAEDPFFLHETFQGNERRLIISISPTTGSETTVYQKEEKPKTEYPVGDMIHYIFENTNEISAVWYTQNYTTLLVGNISLEEMKKIIDSVYEVKT